MALYANTEKLTELFGMDGQYVRLSDKIIYLGELKAWKRSADAVHQYLDAPVVYTKDGSNVAGKFIYNAKGELYVVSDNVNEYCYYVKSYDAQSNTIVISYDTYNNIKAGTLSDEKPLGEESILYVRDTTSDKTL